MRPNVCATIYFNFFIVEFLTSIMTLILCELGRLIVNSDSVFLPL